MPSACSEMLVRKNRAARERADRADDRDDGELEARRLHAPARSVASQIGPLIHLQAFFGACRRRAPAVASDLKVPKDAFSPGRFRCRARIRTSPSAFAVGVLRKGLPKIGRRRGTPREFDHPPPRQPPHETIARARARARAHMHGGSRELLRDLVAHGLASRGDGRSADLFLGPLFSAHADGERRRGAGSGSGGWRSEKRVSGGTRLSAPFGSTRVLGARRRHAPEISSQKKIALGRSVRLGGCRA